MSLRTEDDNAMNYNQFQDAFSTILIEKLSRPQRLVKARNKSGLTGSGKSSKGVLAAQPSRDAEELADFTEYIASLTFDSLPLELQTLTHQIWADNPTLQDKYSLPLTSTDVPDHIINSLDARVQESLITYEMIAPPAEDITNLLAPVLTSYLTTITTPPPPPRTTRDHRSECELCDRDWVPLTYHHLIPRFVHAKAVKRGWHREADLQNVAWLCRACHSFVHRFAGHEQLAREYFTVERLLEQQEIRSFAAWVSRVRWKAR